MDIMTTFTGSLGVTWRLGGDRGARRSGTFILNTV